MDLVESEDVFRSALSYALGSTLVCDTLEEAQELCFTKGEKVKKQYFTIFRIELRKLNRMEKFQRWF